MKSYPTTKWAVTAPFQLGFDTEKWAGHNSGQLKSQHLVLIVFWYCAILEVNTGMEPDRQAPIASATKSVYSNLLRIIIAENKEVDYYTEMMEVQEGEDPKPGRYAFPKD